MEKISLFFIKRKMLVTVIVAGIFLYGLQSSFNIKKDAFPEIVLGKIVITIIYPGASARDVEMNVTVPIEKELREVSDVKEISSISNEGISKIIVTADDNATDQDIQQLYNDVESAIGRVDDLPDDIEGHPVLTKVTSHDFPFIEIAFTGTYERLLEILPAIQNKIRRIKHISAVELIGLADPEVNVLINPVKAKKEYIGLKMVAGAIKERNLEGSGGTLESPTGEKKVVSINKYKNYKEILNTNIRTSQDATKYGVKIKDIANIKIEPKNDKLIVRNNGKRGATLILKKNKSGDVIETSNRVYSFLNELKLPKDISWKIHLDNSSLARNRLELTLNNALMGLGIVLILLFIIFDFKSAFWTAFGIPFSILFAIIFLKGSGNTINLISMAGMIIVIGMLVDDAIVMTEQYQNNTSKGMNGKDAAYGAVEKMWKPILAGLMTTALAFMPLGSVGGFPGKFIWQIPFVLVLALIGSMIDVFFFLPAHISKDSKKSFFKFKKKRHDGGISFPKSERVYKKILIKSLQFRYPILLTAIIILVLGIFLMKNHIRKDSFPQEGVENFTIQLTYPKGQSMERTEQKIKIIEQLIRESIHDDEFIGLSSRIGTTSTDITTEIGTQENLAVLFVYLTPFNTRKRDIFQILKSVEDNLEKNDIPKSVHYRSDIVRVGPPMGWPVEIRIVSNKDNLRTRKSEELKNYLKSIKGVSGIDDDIIEGKDELNISMNYDLISRVGLSVKDILETLHISFDGLIVSNLRDIDRDMDIRLRLNKKSRTDMNFIKTLPVMNNRGNIINLDQVLKIENQKAQGEIKHFNGTRATTIFANTDRKIISGTDVYSLVKKKFKNTKNYSIEYDGEPIEQAKIFASLGGAFGVAMLSIFLVMALIFNSFTRPFIIMLSLPFCLPGVAFTLFAHNYPMSMMAGGATIGLMGVIVNASIVIIDLLTREEEAAGALSLTQISEIASTRLRPIMLSTLSTVAGLMPTAYGLGGYDPFVSQMCAALAWGLIFGTLITLILIPVIYRICIYDLGIIKNKAMELIMQNR